MSTFLELVNEVVYESKVTLDPLLSGNFASPPRTSMYGRIKRWVNQSYTELLNDKPEWFFKNERAVITVRPRLLVTNIDLITNPMLFINDRLIGEKSGVVIQVESVDILLEPGDGTEGDEITIGYSVISGDANDMVLNEYLTLDPIAVGPDISQYARIGGRGRYDLAQNRPQMDSVLESSVMIQPAVDFQTNPGPGDLNGLWPVNVLSTYTPMDTWGDMFALSPGRPAALIRARNGLYELYPHPDQPYDISFSYNVRPVPMVNHDSTPALLPEKYHEYLVWAAIEKLADFNSDQKLYVRAKKTADKYRSYLYRDYMPHPKLFLAAFDQNNGAYDRRN